MSSCIALADTCCFTSKSTQVVELCTSNPTSFYEVDVVNDRCVKWKDSLNAYTKACLSHCNGFASAAVFASNHNAFERLQSFLRFGFLNSHVDAYRISRLKPRNVLTQLGLFNSV